MSLYSQNDKTTYCKWTWWIPKINMAVKNITKLMPTCTSKKTNTINCSIQTPDKKLEELLNCIHSTKMELIDANINFQFAKEPELIDYYSYTITATQKKYDYYIRNARENGIKVPVWKDFQYQNSLNYFVDWV